MQAREAMLKPDQCAQVEPEQHAEADGDEFEAQGDWERVMCRPPPGAVPAGAVPGAAPAAAAFPLRIFSPCLIRRS